MKIEKLALLNMCKKEKVMKAFSARACTSFATKHSKILFSGFIENKNMKYFHITDTTKKRISNVPTEDITGGKLIDLKEKTSSGLVFFNDGLHFLYLIRNNGVYLMSSRSEHKRITDDVDFYLSNMMSGFLYYDFFCDSSNCWINNVLDISKHKDHLLLKEKKSMQILKNIIKDGEKSNTLFEDYKSDYVAKFEDTKLCLQAFLFIHFAKVITTTRISEEFDSRTFSEKIRNKTNSNIDIIQVDTLFDETMKVINPFSVSGHYRNQPVGFGRNETKLIYIDSFMKSGYTRLATKEKINNHAEAN